MVKPSNRYVLDACALIAFFNDEEGADKLEILFEQAQENQVELYIGSVNLFEVYYNALRSTSTLAANELLTDLYSLPIAIMDHIDPSLIHLAAHFKIAHRMSVADSFALALAKHLNAFLVSTDHHEFDNVEKSGEARFYWLR